MKLNENIRMFRINAGMSQADLGKALGLSAQAVSKWENGKAEPDSVCIQRMCDLFMTTPDKLYGYESNIFDVAAGSVDIQNAADAASREQPDGMARGGIYGYQTISGHTSTELRGSVPYYPATAEAKVLARGIDRMPEADRKRLLKMVDLMFEQYKEFFEGTDSDDT